MEQGSVGHFLGKRVAKYVVRAVHRHAPRRGTPPAPAPPAHPEAPLTWSTSCWSMSAANSWPSTDAACSAFLATRTHLDRCAPRSRRVPNRARRRHSVPLPLEGVARQLLEKERIALGLGDQRLGQHLLVIMEQRTDDYLALRRRQRMQRDLARHTTCRSTAPW